MSELKRTYQRSQVFSFFELNEAQQVTATDQLGAQAEDNNFVLWNDEPLPLGMFMRTDSGLFNGVYGLTAFSAYFIKLSSDGEQATVVYAYC